MTTASAMGRIGQTSRTVSDIETSKNWYEMVLELPHLHTFGNLSFFDCNGTRLMLTQEGTMHANESIPKGQGNAKAMTSSVATITTYCLPDASE